MSPCRAAFLVGCFFVVLGGHSQAALPDGALAQIGTPRPKHNGPVYLVRYSSDGKLLASAGIDKLVKLWDTETGREVRQLQGHTETVYALAFAPDGKTLVSGSRDKTVRLWDVASGKEIGQFKGHEAMVLAVAFAPDGKTVASESHDMTVRVWEVGTLKELFRVPGHKSNGTSNVVFSPDGSALATVDDEHAVRLWDAKTGKPLAACKGHASDMESVAFFPDGKHLVTGSVDLSIRLWNAETGAEERKIGGFKNWINAVAVSPDGKTLAAGSQEPVIRLFDTEGKELRQLKGHIDRVKSVTFAPDGKTLASGSLDGTVRFWSVATGKELPQSAFQIAHTALSPDGTVLATSGADTAISLWNPRTGKLLRELTVAKPPITALAFSADGKRLAAAVGDFSIQRWDPNTGELLRPLEGHRAIVRHIVYAPDGKNLVSEGNDGALCLWDPVSGKEKRRFARDIGAQILSTFTPDSRFLLTALESQHIVSLLDVAGGNVVRTFKVDVVPAYSLALSVDGKTLAINDSVGKLWLWEVETGYVRAQPAWEIPVNFRMAFTPDGRALAYSSNGNPTRIVELATNKKVSQLAATADWMTRLAWSRDGSFLVTATVNGTATVWDGQKLLKDLRPRSAKRTPEELETLWKDLAKPEGQQSYQAGWSLDEAPAQATELFAARLKPLEAIRAKPERLTRLIDDLDADDPERREAASDELLTLGKSAEATLKAVLKKGASSAEMRVRLETLLRQIEKNAVSASELRGLRAVEILERLRTKEARALLAALAKGDEGARLTQEAKAALERLGN